MIATVDLVRVGKGVWHIRRDDHSTMCHWEWEGDVTAEDGFDPHVVQFKGKVVCARCRANLRRA